MIVSCAGKSTQEQNSNDVSVEKKLINVPDFNALNAYENIKSQLNFGPRIPGTEGHEKCAQWLIGTFTDLSDTVVVQEGVMKRFDGEDVPVKNIMASLNPEEKARVLLVAHYDTRPWADEDDDKSVVSTPIPGANDGGSGVAVIMELARVLSESGYKKGVDFLLVDAEDSGIPEHLKIEGENSDDSWCLGTQYFLESKLGRSIPYDSEIILLDMVGGKGARFNPEYFSQRYAPNLVSKLWGAARQAGLENYFPEESGNPITDDHIYFLKKGYKAIDIIENNNPLTGSFNPNWHTLSDNLDNIDKNVLGAVGQTILYFLYYK